MSLQNWFWANKNLLNSKTNIFDSHIFYGFGTFIHNLNSRAGIYRSKRWESSHLI